MNLFEVKNLSATIDSLEVLKSMDLKIGPGEVHAFMGPNGSGKSTFSKVVAGHPDYEVTSGEVLIESGFEMKNILDLEIYERAREGVFLGFQYPVSLPGLSNFDFLHLAFNTQCEHQGAAVLSRDEFETLVLAKMKTLKMDPYFLKRGVNQGFSGGEKKRNEILQMMILSPRLSILDEIDSGLDVDALQVVAAGVNSMRNCQHSVLLITHYQRLLDYIEPDFVHIFKDGKIVKSGDAKLALEVETKGYDWVTR